MRDQQQSEYVIVNPQKSLVAAIFLSLFFGPVGMLYAGFWHGVIMTALMILFPFVPKIGYILFIILWLVGPYWSVLVCSRYNDRFRR
jgi:hypothetical protein